MVGGCQLGVTDAYTDIASIEVTMEIAPFPSARKEQKRGSAEKRDAKEVFRKHLEINEYSQIL